MERTDTKKTVKLSEACSYSKGKKPPILKGIKTSNTTIPYINIKAFEKGIYDEYTNGDKCNLCNDGDILMVWDGARCGMVGKAKKGAVGSTLMKITPKPNVLNEYLYYFLDSQFHILNTNPKGVGIPHIEPQLLWNLELRIPSMEEQTAIVSKIEELFSELESGKQQLLKAQEQLKVYRQSLLKAAFEGKLTNDNLKEGELPIGWKWVKSGDLFSFVTSGSRGWSKYFSSQGALFIRISNLNFNTLDLDLSEEKVQFVNPPSNSEGIRTKVKEGDFLFSITGYLGMFAIAPKLANAFVNQHVCLCRPKEGFNKQYVGYWIISEAGGIYHLNKNKKGAVKAGLNLDDLKNFPVPMCSPEEQLLIVSKLESKLTVCDNLEETISQGLQQAEMLRQSILKRAFEGKLVAYKELANTL